MLCFGIADESSRQSVGTDELFSIALPETPTTGYRWGITELTGPLVIVDDRFSPPQSMRPGAGGERRWLLRANGVGTAAFRAELARMSGAAPASSFNLTIEIAPAD